jgi:sRNA-binding protein
VIPELDARQVRAALAMHRGNAGYLRALFAPGAQRVDLAGVPIAQVTPEEAADAVERLAAQKARHVARKAAKAAAAEQEAKPKAPKVAKPKRPTAPVAKKKRPQKPPVVTVVRSPRWAPEGVRGTVFRLGARR